LHGRHLTRQSLHFVHRNSGSDRCITQAGFANCFFHANRSEFRHIGEHRSESLFSLGYCDSFSRGLGDCLLAGR
jgi:hypothetical protein